MNETKGRHAYDGKTYILTIAEDQCEIVIPPLKRDEFLCFGL